ncbi:CHAT domain-containing protein, partial [Phormidium sp. CCY1219]|uniref:CHAT domain-containing protein n=1 Tax=Phormidium sp. CCY1219 TaxID=2886104 RepID=UPI002D1EDDE4
DLPTGDRAAHLQRAIECYQAALTVWTPELFPLECLQTARNWANLEFTEGHWQAALTQYQVAIEAIERSRRSALSEDRRQQIVRESLHVYENAIQAAINLNRISTALEIVERVRAKRLVDLMATADLYQGGDIPREVRQCLQRLDELDGEILQKRQEYREPETADNPPSPGDDPQTPSKSRVSHRRQLRAATEVTVEITHLEDQKQAILDQLSGMDEAVAKLRELQPPKLADFQPLRQEKTALLSFYTTDADTHIFILRPGAHQPHCFTCKGQGYETLQGWLWEKWVVPYAGYGGQNEKPKPRKQKWKREFPRLLAELSQRLELDRLIREYLEDMEELVLVPHLLLHHIPFAALPLNTAKQGQSQAQQPTAAAFPETYLGDKFLLRYAPSLQVLGFCHNRPSVSDATYATAENATDDLPFSCFEGMKVAELFQVDRQRRLIGANATREAYRQLLATANCLVSTHHAQSRFDNPLESGLRLSDGTISVSQLFSPAWRFRQLEEVYLSCCETGLFLPRSGIDEPVAVSTGFLCAGARGVIASQWSIYDCSSALLSSLYHKYRQQGRNRPRALQLAQREMRQMTGAEFREHHSKAMKRAVKAEGERLDKNGKPVEPATDAEKLIRQYAADKGCPFQHPVHWAGLACYGLG